MNKGDEQEIPEDGVSQQTDETESQYNEFMPEYEMLSKHIEEVVKQFVLALLSKIDMHVIEFGTHYGPGDEYDDGHYPGEDGDPADF